MKIHRNLLDWLLRPLCWLGWHSWWWLGGGIWEPWVGCRRCLKEYRGVVKEKP